MFNLQQAEQLRTKTKSAKIFGFILYNQSHLNIIKVLRDEDYWAGFDIDSDGWIVYSIRPQEGKYGFPKSQPGVMQMMVAIWREPHENMELLDTFQIKDTRDLPCFIAFTINDNGDIERTIKKIKDDSIDNARNSIKRSIEIISNTISQISPEYKNSSSVYREVKENVESEIFRENAGKALKLFSFLKSLTS